ncbi:MAG: sortase [Candidatus Pacebacteria bacterium]|nr:sortase [Candidatus Paceibacterota bacterium]
MNKEDKIFWTQSTGIFLVTLFILAILGFLPENLIPREFTTTQGDDTENRVDYSKTASVDDPNSLKEVSYVRDNSGRILRSSDNSETVLSTDTYTKPSRVVIPGVGIDSVVLQPNSPDISVLDSALEKGAVYYPGSGVIEQGNIFLFGHSSSLPVVVNQAYKTFSGIEKSRIGDEIILYDRNGKKYTYEIERVYQANAETAFIDLSRSGQRLTISTCNSFGSKSDRWVVDAILKV